MKLALVFALLISAVPSCMRDQIRLGVDPATEGSIATVRTSVGQSFRLRLGEAAEVKDTPLLVGFREVASDTRCPIDVQCVSAGDAVATIGAINGDQPWRWARLHTGAEPRQLRDRGFAVELISLEPHQRAGTTIALGDYVAVLRVTRE